MFPLSRTCRFRPRFLSLHLPLLVALLLPSFLMAAPDKATKPLSVEQVVDIALANNAKLRATRNNVEVAVAGIKTAGAIPNPRLESMSGSNRALLPNVNGGTVFGMGFSQLIENPSLRRARIDSAEFGRDSSAQNLASAANELATQVRAKAYEHLLRKEEEKAAFDALTLLEQIRLRVKLRVDSGEAARYEMIKADAEVINARQKYQTSTLLVEQSVLALNRLAAGQLPTKWVLVESLTDPVDMPALSETLNFALLNNPELKLLQSEVNKRQAKLKESKLGRWPGVEIRYTQVRDPEIRQNALMASVQIPLFDQRSGPIAEAGAELSRANIELEGRKIDLEQQISLAWKSLQIARIRVSALSTGAVVEAQAALRVAEAAYRFGERGILDVLDAQRLLRSVNADLLDARYQYQLAKIELLYLTGSDTMRSKAPF